jgi:squalene-hopene/tetraprenyl-beta-curcumene cyclase
MAVSPAIDAAIEFLLTACDAEGWWRDFDVAGQSDAWVTGYVGSILADAQHPGAREAARRAWRLLRRQRWWSAGWGYHARVPADADSTVWAMRLAEGVEVRASLRQRRSFRFLLRHVRPGGGVATYSTDGPIRHFTRMFGYRFDGWCAAHTCVTAAAAGLTSFPARERLLDYLRHEQWEDGRWTGYWWADPEYATALAAEALARGAFAEDQKRVQRAVRWACGRIGGEGVIGLDGRPGSSSFATACCLRTLALDENRILEHRMGATEATVYWLLQQQSASGAWPPSARLRVPPPKLIDAERLPNWGRGGQGQESIGSIVLDVRGVFTTATVLWALHAIRSIRP